jgi:hypothetical protein
MFQWSITRIFASPGFLKPIDAHRRYRLETSGD